MAEELPPIMLEFRANFNHLESALKTVTEDLKKVKTQSAEVGSAMQRMGEESARGAKGVAGGVVLGNIWTALGQQVLKFGKDAVTAYTDTAKETLQLQRVLGGTAEDMSGLLAVSDRFGISTDTLTRSMRQFSVHLMKNDALTRAMGVSLTDASGKPVPFTQNLGKLADEFQKMPDGMTKTAIAQQLFGRNATALLPLLNQGSAGLRKYAAEAKAAGLVLSQSDITATKDFNMKLKDLQETLKGVMVSMGRQLLPILSQLASTLGPVLAKVAATVSGVLLNVVKGIAPLVAPLMGLISKLEGVVGGGLQRILTAVSGALSKVAVALGPLLGKLGDLVNVVIAALVPALTPLLDALGPITAALASALIPVISMLIPVVQQLAPVLASVAVTLGQMLIAVAPLLPAVGQLIAVGVQMKTVWLGPAIALLQTMVSVLGNVLPPVIRFVVGLLKGLIDGFVSVMNFILNSVVKRFLDALSTMASSFAGFLSNTLGRVPLIGGMFRTIGNTISSYAAKVKTSVDALTKTASGDATKFAKSWNEALSSKPGSDAYLAQTMASIAAAKEHTKAVADHAKKQKELNTAQKEHLDLLRQQNALLVQNRNLSYLAFQTQAQNLTYVHGGSSVTVPVSIDGREVFKAVQKQALLTNRRNTTNGLALSGSVV